MERGNTRREGKGWEGKARNWTKQNKVKLSRIEWHGRRRCLFGKGLLDWAERGRADRNGVDRDWIGYNGTGGTGRESMLGDWARERDGTETGRDWMGLNGKERDRYNKTKRKKQGRIWPIRKGTELGRTGRRGTGLDGRGRHGMGRKGLGTVRDETGTDEPRHDGMGRCKWERD